jgi:hypothetical protein
MLPGAPRPRGTIGAVVTIPGQRNLAAAVEKGKSSRMVLIKQERLALEGRGNMY